MTPSSRPLTFEARLTADSREALARALREMATSIEQGRMPGVMVDTEFRAECRLEGEREGRR